MYIMIAIYFWFICQQIIEIILKATVKYTYISKTHMCILCKLLLDRLDIHQQSEVCRTFACDFYLIKPLIYIHACVIILMYEYRLNI